MMFDVHPTLFQRLTSRNQNREIRTENACHSKGHPNIAPSNDKRPLFVQILATSSASLISTPLPIQCLRLSNFFFFRGIFLNNFLCQLLVTRVSSKFDHTRGKNTRTSSKFDHTPAFSCSRVIKIRSRVNKI